MKYVRVFERADEVWALIHFETKEGLVTEAQARQLEDVGHCADLAGSVQILGSLPVSEAVVQYLQNANSVSFQGTDSLTISKLLPFCNNVRNLKFSACELPTDLSTRANVNLTLEDCQNTSKVDSTDVIGLIAHIPLLETISTSLVKAAVTVFLTGASGINEDAYVRRSQLRLQDMGFLMSAQVIFHLGLQSLEFSGEELQPILKLRMSQLSFSKCVLSDYHPFSGSNTNNTITHLEIEMDGMTSECLRDLIERLAGLTTLTIRNRPLSRADLQELSSARLKLLDISSCWVDEIEGVRFTRVENVTVSSTQLEMHPQLPLSFPSSKIEVVDAR